MIILNIAYFSHGSGLYGERSITKCCRTCSKLPHRTDSIVVLGQNAERCRGMRAMGGTTTL